MNLDYNVIMRFGDKPRRPKMLFGTLIDIEDVSIVAEDDFERVSNDNDFSSPAMGQHSRLTYTISHF